MNSATSSLRLSGGAFFCAGLSWWLYIIGMGPRAMPLIFEFSDQKLAIYTIGDRTERRAGSDGRWISKLCGKLDISHVLSGLEGKEYGNVVFATKNRRTSNSLDVSAK